MAKVDLKTKTGETVKKNTEKLTVAPVATAISARVFFLLSPNPGAFTATTCSPIFSLEVKIKFYFNYNARACRIEWTNKKSTYFKDSSWGEEIT